MSGSTAPTANGEGPGLTAAIVVPARNEASQIGGVLADVRANLAAGFRYLVIVIDDGSSDGTGDLARAAGADVVLRNEVGTGYGNALRQGCLEASRLNASVIVTFDGDGQHAGEDLHALLRPFAEGSAEFVKGSRRLAGSMPFRYRLGNFFLTSYMRLLFGLRCGDTQSGLRAFATSRLGDLNWVSNDYAITSEMLVRAHKSGMRVEEVPIATIYHDARKGTQVSDGISIAWRLLAWRLRGLPRAAS
jgi:glycosyltransferase involved in cell wall biosynthesis